MTTSSSKVTLDPTSPNLPQIRLEILGDDELSGGVGGWVAVSRPRRVAATEWGGFNPWQLVLPLLVSGMESYTSHDTSVEPTIRALLAMARKTKETAQPAVLRITGPVRQPSAAIRWTINDLAWGVQYRNSAGNRVYQEVTVTLLQHVEATVLKGPAAKHRAKKKPKKKKK